MMFETERLVLRRWEESDADSLYEYARDPAVGPIAGWPPHRSVEESRRVIRTVFSGKEAYAVCLKEDLRAIGAIELKLNGHTDMTESDDECEMGYWLGRPFWGRGLMPEAVREMLRHAFEDLKMTRVWIGYYEGNDKSKRVQEKCGFRYQWRSEDVDVPLMGEKRTGHVSSITKDQWLCDRMLAAAKAVRNGIKIETERLLLREYTMDDFDALYEIMSDEETMRHYPKPFDKDKTRGWIAWNLDNYKKYGFGLWAVTLKETGEFIGDCGITLQLIDGETLPEIGYHIHKKYWRRGFAKEAARAVRDWVFENTDYDAVWSYMKYTNVASYSTALANGMKKVKEYPDPKNTISYACAITREEWERIKNDRITELLDKFVERSKDILKDSLCGIYLHGSAVMGCFSPEKSDIDLIVVVNGAMDDAAKRAFLDMTAELNAAAPPKGIEMSVVQRYVCDPFLYPTPFETHFSAGHLKRYRDDPEDYVRKMTGTDRDLAAHFTVILSRGRCLYGLPIGEVFGEVPKRDYLDALLYDVEGAREEIAQCPMYFILNLARVLAYLREGKVLSKKEGGEWALKNLPAEHHDLIRAALDEYTRNGDAVYDREHAEAYAEYMLKEIAGGVSSWNDDTVEKEKADKPAE